MGELIERGLPDAARAELVRTYATEIARDPEDANDLLDALEGPPTPAGRSTPSRHAQELVSVESVREVLLPVEPVAREVAATEHHVLCASRKSDECNCFKRSTIYLLADAVLAALAAAEEPGAQRRT